LEGKTTFKAEPEENTFGDRGGKSNAPVLTGGETVFLDARVKGSQEEQVKGRNQSMIGSLSSKSRLRKTLRGRDQYLRPSNGDRKIAASNQGILRPHDALKYPLLRGRRGGLLNREESIMHKREDPESVSSHCRDTKERKNFPRTN